MLCRSVAPHTTHAQLSAENSARAAIHLPLPRSRTRCRIPTGNATTSSLASWSLRSRLSRYSFFRWTCLQIPSSRLLHFDRFKLRFEIPLAKSAAALALDDFEEHGRPIFHRLRENLQEVAFLVAVHKYTERPQLCQRFLHWPDPRRQRLIIGVGNAQKIEPVALQFADRVHNILALQRDVLRPRSSVSLNVFLNLALVARRGRVVDRKFHRMRIVRHHDSHQRAVLSRNILIL